MIATRRIVLAGGAVLAAPNITRANSPRRWRMVTSWTRNLVGPGVTADRLARRITAMSDGALSIELFSAGELVPALHVFDAVANKTVEMGHTAALFTAGKIPSASVFTTVPFGMSPVQHAGWLDAEGQGLWDQLYAPFRVKPFLSGNTGPSSAGWFQKIPKSLGDMSGLRIRATGLGGEVYRRMGATALTIAPGESYAALERGVIDAAEFLAPANDLALGLNRIAPFLAFPGFNKPNGASELLIGAELWHDLPAHLKAIIEAATRVEHDLGLAEAGRLNAAALRKLLETGTTVQRLPEDILRKGAVIAEEILNEIGQRDALSTQVIASYRASQNEASRAWAGLSRQ